LPPALFAASAIPQAYDLPLHRLLDYWIAPGSLAHFLARPRRTWLWVGLSLALILIGIVLLFVWRSAVRKIQKEFSNA